MRLAMLTGGEKGAVAGVNARGLEELSRAGALPCGVGSQLDGASLGDRAGDSCWV